MQCIAFMNLIYLLYSHSAAFSESEALHLLTSSLFKPACFHGSSLTLIFQLCDMESRFSYNIVKLLLLLFFFVTWYFTKFSSKNVQELFKTHISPRGKQWLVLQRKKCHMAERILSLFPEAKGVARGRKLTIIILPRN